MKIKLDYNLPFPVRLVLRSTRTTADHWHHARLFSRNCGVHRKQFPEPGACTVANDRTVEVNVFAANLDGTVPSSNQ
jgi:hypothetical protein